MNRYFIIMLSMVLNVYVHAQQPRAVQLQATEPKQRFAADTKIIHNGAQKARPSTYPKSYQAKGSTVRNTVATKTIFDVQATQGVGLQYANVKKDSLPLGNAEKATDLPAIFAIYIIDKVDYNSDGYYEEWKFEVDVDAFNGGIAFGTYIDIDDEKGNHWTFGPFDFFGNGSSDNIVLSGFNANNYGFVDNHLTSYAFKARNEAGFSTKGANVPVSYSLDSPQFYEVLVGNTQDANFNGYLEVWDFEIDIDPSFGGMAAGVNIDVTDNYGHAWYFGPWDFIGQNGNDNVFLTDFSNDYYTFSQPTYVTFTFRAFNDFGEATTQVVVKVDKSIASPVLYSVNAVNTVDYDHDGFFESWDFELDVDARNGTSVSNVMIKVSDNVGNSWQFGPMDFAASGSGDNFVITDFSSLNYGFVSNTYVLFTFQVYNANGNDSKTKNMPVDESLDKPTFYQILAINKTDSDGDNFYNHWDFQVDIDPATAGVAKDVYITVTDELGNNWGKHGPFSFKGKNGSDDVLITDFDANWFGQVTARNIKFFFVAENTLGSVSSNFTLAVDKSNDAPYIYDVQAINKVDTDNDGALEAWDYKIDLDASYKGLAENITLRVNDSQGNQRDFGPYSITGQVDADAFTISHWDMKDFGLQSPQDVYFTFRSFNANGSHDTVIITRVDGTSNDAALSNLLVDGVGVNGFYFGTYNYTQKVAFSTQKIPVVSAVARNNDANIQITQALSLDGTLQERTAKIVVTAQDGTTQRTYTVVFERLAASSNASLQTLMVDGKMVDNFQANTLLYSYKVPYEHTIVPVVTAQTTDVNAQMTITQALNLDGTEIERTATVAVTAEDGTTKREYKVVFAKNPPATDALLSDLRINNTTVDGFMANNLDYFVDVPYSSTQIPLVSATAKHAYATMVINQATNIDGTDAERTAKITVTAQDNITKKVYTVMFSRMQPSGDAVLKEIRVNNVVIADFSPESNMYVEIVPYNATQIPVVTFTTNHPNATAEKTNAISLNGSEAERTTTIVVTAEDQIHKRTYSIIFQRDNPSSDATLSEIKINGQAIADFNANTLDYEQKLHVSTTVVPSVTARTSNEFATIQMEYAVNLTGNQGERTTKIKVTAQNGINQKIYTVLFTLDPSIGVADVSYQTGVFPNPTQGQLFVKAPHGSQATICDLSGRQLTAFDVTNEATDISYLPQGVFLLYIKHNQNISVHKIVKN